MGYGSSSHESEDRHPIHEEGADRLRVRQRCFDRQMSWSSCSGPEADHGATRRERCVWAVEIGGHLVGTIGLVSVGSRAARIQWFRIEPEWQHTSVLSKLIGQLRDHCQEHGYLRIGLDAHIAPHWIWRLLVRRGFRLTRRIRGPQGEVLEFALEPRERTG